MQVTQDTEPGPKHPYLRMGCISVTDVFWDLLQEKQWDPSIPPSSMVWDHTHHTVLSLVISFYIHKNLYSELNLSPHSTRETGSEM